MDFDGKVAGLGAGGNVTFEGREVHILKQNFKRNAREDRQVLPSPVTAMKHEFIPLEFLVCVCSHNLISLVSV